MPITVLSKLTSADFASATLLTQMGASFRERAEKVSDGIAGDYQQKINSVNMNADKWRKVEAEVGKATTKLSAVLGDAKYIRAKLDNMIQSINQATQVATGDTNYEGYAATFDSLLKGMIDSAEKSDSSVNLLGEGTSRYTFDTGINGETRTVNGSYLGSDYYITDTAGMRWQPDRVSKLLMRYSDYPNDPLPSDSANFETGLRLDSISGDAVSFTTGPDTGNAQSFSGTITRSGLEVMDSIFYDGLATDAGRTRALADLNAAKEAVNLEVSRYEAEITMAKFYENRAVAESRGITNETNNLLIENAQAVNKAQNALQLEFDAAQSKLARAMALKNDYANMLTPFIKNKFARSFFNIFA